jgi:hypothetical protein
MEKKTVLEPTRHSTRTSFVSKRQLKPNTLEKICGEECSLPALEINCEEVTLDPTREPSTSITSDTTSSFISSNNLAVYNITCL